MEAKKSEKADLEKKKGLFLEIGLVIILLIVLVAFNIKSYDKTEIVVEHTGEAVIDDIEIQITKEETPPPPEPEPEQVATDLKVVDDNKVIENEFIPVDADAKDVTNGEVVAAPIEEDVEEDIQEIFVAVENSPEFPGGEAALYEYLGKNINYPEMARQQNIMGRVFVTFVVERDGSIANPRVLRDIGGGCGDEAVRVVRSMPKWKPGKQRGKAVRVQYNLPVVFQLD